MYSFKTYKIYLLLCYTAAIHPHSRLISEFAADLFRADPNFPRVASLSKTIKSIISNNVFFFFLFLSLLFSKTLVVCSS